MKSHQLILALSGALPALGAMWYIDRLDAKRPEPRWTLRWMAILGALSCIPVIVVGLFLGGFDPGGVTYASAFYKSFVVAGFTEEAAKLACVWFLVWRRPEFNERMDGIVYAAHAGLGFALIENVLYLLRPMDIGAWLTMFIGRAILAIPLHAICAGMMGYFAARKRFDGKGIGILGGFIVAVLIHGFYDAFLFSIPVANKLKQEHLILPFLLIPIGLVIGGAIALRIMAKRAIAADDQDERLHPPQGA